MCHFIDTRSYQPNQASCTHDSPSPLVFSTLFSSLSPICLFLVHNSTIIAEHKLKSSLYISPSHHHELTPSTAYTKYIHRRVQHTPSTAYTKYSIHQVQHTPSTAYTKYSIHQVQHTQITAYTEYSIHQVQHTPSTAYTAYSTHRVQHTLSTASTQECLSSLHSHDCKVTPECSVSFWCASLHDRPLVRIRVILFDHCLRSVSLNLLNYGIQVRTIMALKCISKVAPSQHSSECPNSLDYGLPVRTIKASKCISSLAGAWSRSASLSSLDHGLQVYLQISVISAWTVMFNLAQSLPRSVSLSSIDHHFQARLILLSSTACRQSRYTVCRWVAI